MIPVPRPSGRLAGRPSEAAVAAPRSNGTPHTRVGKRDISERCASMVVPLWHASSA